MFPTDLELNFVVARPFVIAFDTTTRRIVRILYGAQDFPRVFRNRR
jgi:plasmid stabilization system protein ParE